MLFTGLLPESFSATSLHHTAHAVQQSQPAQRGLGPSPLISNKDNILQSYPYGIMERAKFLNWVFFFPGFSVCSQLEKPSQYTKNYDETKLQFSTDLQSHPAVIQGDEAAGDGEESDRKD